jgi:phosphoribosylformylglycinamidine (FGAM) synthase-like enzyme
MALTIYDEDVQTATVTTEHDLFTVTDAGIYVLAVDLAELINGDAVTLRVKTKLTTGDTLQLAYDGHYTHAQARLNVFSPPVPSPIEIVGTLEQTAGTSRDFIWALYKL